MKTQLISLMAVVALLAVTVPATASDSTATIPPPPCARGITINDAQDCITYAGQVANREIDYAQDQVENVLTLVCDIACNFIVVADSSSGGADVMTTRCGVATVNDLQECITYVVVVVNVVVDYAQDEVEYAKDVVCGIACNALATTSSSSSWDTTLVCRLGTVNDLQDCITWAVATANKVIDIVQDEIEYVLTVVCDIACNFVSTGLPSSSMSASLPVAKVVLPCKVGTVNDLQACLTWAVAYLNSWVDYAQYLVEWTLDQVCDIACNLAAPSDGLGAVSAA